jgi:hypothetical protein
MKGQPTVDSVHGCPGAVDRLPFAVEAHRLRPPYPVYIDVRSHRTRVLASSPAYKNVFKKTRHFEGILNFARKKYRVTSVTRCTIRQYLRSHAMQETSVSNETHKHSYLLVID